MIYNEKVINHFRNPRNVGKVKNASGIGEAGSARCGDIMRIHLKIGNNIVEDVESGTYGCGSTIASSSMAIEPIKGKTAEEVWELSDKAVAEALDGLPPVKVCCSVLAEKATRKTVNDYRQRQGLEPWDMKEHSHDIHEHVHG